MVDWRSRPRSQNVDDRSEYFGTGSVDPGYYSEDRYADFARESILSPYLSGPPQKLRPEVGLTIEDLLALLAAQQRGTTSVGTRGVFDSVKAGVLR